MKRIAKTFFGFQTFSTRERRLIADWSEIQSERSNLDFMKQPTYRKTARKAAEKADAIAKAEQDKPFAGAAYEPEVNIDRMTKLKAEAVKNLQRWLDDPDISGHNREVIEEALNIMTKKFADLGADDMNGIAFGFDGNRLYVISATPEAISGLENVDPSKMTPEEKRKLGGAMGYIHSKIAEMHEDDTGVEYDSLYETATGAARREQHEKEIQGYRMKRSAGSVRSVESVYADIYDALRRYKSEYHLHKEIREELETSPQKLLQKEKEEPERMKSFRTKHPKTYIKLVKDAAVRSPYILLEKEQQIVGSEDSADAKQMYVFLDLVQEVTRANPEAIVTYPDRLKRIAKWVSVQNETEGYTENMQPILAGLPVYRRAFVVCAKSRPDIFTKYLLQEYEKYWKQDVEAGEGQSAQSGAEVFAQAAANAIEGDVNVFWQGKWNPEGTPEMRQKVIDALSTKAKAEIVRTATTYEHLVWLHRMNPEGWQKIVSEILEFREGGAYKGLSSIVGNDQLIRFIRFANKDVFDQIETGVKASTDEKLKRYWNENKFLIGDKKDRDPGTMFKDAASNYSIKTKDIFHESGDFDVITRNMSLTALKEFLDEMTRSLTALDNEEKAKQIVTLFNNVSPRYAEFPSVTSITEDAAEAFKEYEGNIYFDLLETIPTKQAAAALVYDKKGASFEGLTTVSKDVASGLVSNPTLKSLTLGVETLDETSAAQLSKLEGALRLINFTLDGTNEDALDTLMEGEKITGITLGKVTSLTEDQAAKINNAVRKNSQMRFIGLPKLDLTGVEQSEYNGLWYLLRDLPEGCYIDLRGIKQPSSRVIEALRQYEDRVILDADVRKRVGGKEKMLKEKDIERPLPESTKAVIAVLQKGVSNFDANRAQSERVYRYAGDVHDTWITLGTLPETLKKFEGTIMAAVKLRIAKDLYEAKKPITAANVAAALISVKGDIGASQGDIGTLLGKLVPVTAMEVKKKPEEESLETEIAPPTAPPPTEEELKNFASTIEDAIEVLQTQLKDGYTVSISPFSPPDFDGESTTAIFIRKGKEEHKIVVTVPGMKVQAGSEVDTDHPGWESFKDADTLQDKLIALAWCMGVTKEENNSASSKSKSLSDDSEMPETSEQPTTPASSPEALQERIEENIAIPGVEVIVVKTDTSGHSATLELTYTGISGKQNTTEIVVDTTNTDAQIEMKAHTALYKKYFESSEQEHTEMFNTTKDAINKAITEVLTFAEDSPWRVTYYPDQNNKSTAYHKISVKNTPYTDIDILVEKRTGKVCALQNNGTYFGGKYLEMNEYADLTLVQQLQKIVDAFNIPAEKDVKETDEEKELTKESFEEIVEGVIGKRADLTSTVLDRYTGTLTLVIKKNNIDYVAVQVDQASKSITVVLSLVEGATSYRPDVTIAGFDRLSLKQQLQTVLNTHETPMPAEQQPAPEQDAVQMDDIGGLVNELLDAKDNNTTIISGLTFHRSRNSEDEVMGVNAEYNNAIIIVSFDTSVNEIQQEFNEVVGSYTIRINPTNYTTIPVLKAAVEQEVEKAKKEIDAKDREE